MKLLGLYACSRMPACFSYSDVCGKLRETYSLAECNALDHYYSIYIIYCELTQICRFTPMFRDFFGVIMGPMFTDFLCKIQPKNEKKKVGKGHLYQSVILVGTFE